MEIHYQQEGLSLYQGDARSLDLIQANSVPLIASSPPYFNARAEYSEWKTYDDYLTDMALAMQEAKRISAPDGRIAINVPMGYGRPNSGGYYPIGADWTKLVTGAGFGLLGTIVWDKTSCETNNSGILGSGWGSWMSASAPSLRDGYEIIIVGFNETHKRIKADGQENTIDSITFTEATNALWRIPPVSKKANWHPAPWPPEIPRRLIELYTFRGETVVDMFSGSGTTAWVAQSLGRNGIGIDLNVDYVKQSAGPLLLDFHQERMRQLELV